MLLLLLAQHPSCFLLTFILLSPPVISDCLLDPECRCLKCSLLPLLSLLLPLWPSPGKEVYEQLRHDKTGICAGALACMLMLAQRKGGRKGGREDRHSRCRQGCRPQDGTVEWRISTPALCLLPLPSSSSPLLAPPPLPPPGPPSASLYVRRRCGAVEEEKDSWSSLADC